MKYIILKSRSVSSLGFKTLGFKKREMVTSKETRWYQLQQHAAHQHVAKLPDTPLGHQSTLWSLLLSDMFHDLSQLSPEQKIRLSE